MPRAQEILLPSVPRVTLEATDKLFKQFYCKEKFQQEWKKAPYYYVLSATKFCYFSEVTFLDVLLCDKYLERTCYGVLGEFHFMRNIWSSGYITH